MGRARESHFYPPANRRNVAGAPTPAHPPSPDRTRLALLGYGFLVGGAACLVYTGVGLTNTLPPTLGHTIALFSAGAAGLIFTGTGALYVSVARRAPDPLTEEAGLSLGVDMVTGEPTFLGWDRIRLLRVSAWHLGPSLRNPRFFELEVSAAGVEAPDGQTVVVHVQDPAGFARRLHAAMGDRAVLPDALLD